MIEFILVLLINLLHFKIEAFILLCFRKCIIRLLYSANRNVLSVYFKPKPCPGTRQKINEIKNRAKHYHTLGYEFFNKIKFTSKSNTRFLCFIESFQYNKRIFYICRRLPALPGEFLAPFIRVNPPNINLATTIFCSVYLKAKQLQSGSLRALFVVKKNPLCDHYTTFIKDGRGQDTTPVGFFVYFRWDRGVLTATLDSHMWRKKSKRIRCRVFVNNNK